MSASNYNRVIESCDQRTIIPLKNDELYRITKQVNLSTCWLYLKKKRRIWKRTEFLKPWYVGTIGGKPDTRD